MPLTEATKQTIFNRLKEIQLKHASPLVVGKELPDNFELIGNTPAAYGSKKELVPGMFFSSLVMRKDSVAMHFFPCYMTPGFEPLAPNTWKLLKGLTCFHFKKEEQINEAEIDALYEKGISNFKEKGWII